MDSDDLIIRAARPDEAELLSHMIFRAASYWEYPRELLDHWLEEGRFNVTPEEIERGCTFLVEDEEEDEVLGFYTIVVQGEVCELKHLFVLPEYAGADVREALFFDACELAETIGAEYLTVTVDAHEAGFYEEMGAALYEKRQIGTPLGDVTFDVMRLSL